MAKQQKSCWPAHSGQPLPGMSFPLRQSLATVKPLVYIILFCFITEVYTQFAIQRARYSDHVTAFQIQRSVLVYPKICLYVHLFFRSFNHFQDRVQLGNLLLIFTYYSCSWFVRKHLKFIHLCYSIVTCKY